MKSKRDSYDFSQPSVSGKYGFEIFEKDGSYFFHFNNKSGEGLLYSQGYSSFKSRDRGIKSVIANAANPDRIERADENGKGCYFNLKAGNSQEIASSRLFQNKAEMEANIAVVTSMGKKVPVNEVVLAKETGQKIAEKSAAGKESKEQKQAGKLSKYSFRIDWYPESNMGKIENLVTGDTRNFERLDDNVIPDFLALHTHTQLLKKDVAVKSQKAAVVLPEVPSEPEAAPAELIIKSDAGEQAKNILKVNQLFKLELQTGQLLEPCSVSLVAKSLQDMRKMNLSWVEEIKPKDGKISIPFSSSLTPGSYRLIAEVTPKELSKKLKGSRVVQVC